MIERVVLGSTLILGVSGLAAACAWRRSASLRHAIWLIGLTTSIGLAIAAAFGPVIEVETTVVNGPGVVDFGPEFLEALRAVPSMPAATTATAPTASSSTALPAGPLASPRVSIDPRVVAIAVWLIGVLLILGRAVAGHVGIAQLKRRSSPFTLIEDRVDVRLSADVDVPCTLGTWRPVVLLPADASDWDRERLRIVLVHEIAHVSRFDYAAQLIGTAACAVYWFNPIVWLAVARLRAEAEHAADDRVLAAGVDGVTYASHLLELARPDQGRLSTAVAVGMARGTNRLERRFTAMFDSKRSRGIVPMRLQAAAGSASMLVALPLALVRVVPPAEPMVVATAPAATPVAVVAANPTPTVVAVMPATQRTTSVASVQAFVPRVIVADTIIERTLAAVAGERISIELKLGGGIIIHSWDQPQVRLRAVLSGDQARETRVDFQRTGNGLQLRSYLDYYPNNTRNSNSFELWVPRKFDVDISSAGGEISITGVEGRFSGNTGGGQIMLDGLKGQANLNTGGGEVRVTNSELEGRVTTGGGQALVSNTTGGVRVSSGSGPVIQSSGQTRTYGVGGLAATTTSGGYISGQNMTRIGGVAVDGSVSMSRAGGSIQLDDAPNGGSFTTGGGEIVVGSVGGTAKFTTGGGDIRLDNVKDDVVATTGAGSVEITVVDGNGRARNITVTSGTGRVEIVLPANLDVRFDLETAYTERHGRTSIQSDFPVNVTETDDWDSRNGTPRRFVRGIGGSGRGLIKVRTVNGDVIIRRR